MSGLPYNRIKKKEKKQKKHFEIIRYIEKVCTFAAF